MTSSRSVRVVSSSAGVSASGGRNGGVCARTARSSVPARSAAREGGRRPLAHGDDEVGRQRRQRPGQQPGRRGGEGPEAHRPGRRVRLGRVADGRVELVEHADRPREQPRAGRRQDDAVAPAFEQRPPGDRLERRHLPGDGRLRVPQRARGGRERARLRDLAQHPQPGRREIRSHA